MGCRSAGRRAMRVLCGTAVRCEQCQAGRVHVSGAKTGWPKIVRCPKIGVRNADSTPLKGWAKRGDGCGKGPSGAEGRGRGHMRSGLRERRSPASGGTGFPARLALERQLPGFVGHFRTQRGGTRPCAGRRRARAAAARRWYAVPPGAPGGRAGRPGRPRTPSPRPTARHRPGRKPRTSPRATEPLSGIDGSDADRLRAGRGPVPGAGRPARDRRARRPSRFSPCGPVLRDIGNLAGTPGTGAAGSAERPYPRGSRRPPRSLRAGTGRMSREGPGRGVRPGCRARRGGGRRSGRCPRSVRPGRRPRRCGRAP